MKKTLNQKRYSNFIFAMLLSVLVGILMTWSTQVVWIPSVLGPTVLLTLTYVYNKKIHKHMWIVSGILIGLGVLSTIYQFLFSDIGYGFEVWHGIAISIIIFLLAIATKVIWNSYIDARKTKKDEGIRNEQQKNRLEKEKKFIDKLATMKAASKNSWIEILELSSECKNFNKYLPDSIVASGTLVELLHISHVKKQIHWKDGNFSEAINCIDHAFKNCFIDVFLTKLISQIEELAQYQEYYGYKGIYEVVKSRLTAVAAIYKSPSTNPPHHQLNHPHINH